MGNLFWGWFSDSFGRKPTIVISLLGIKFFVFMKIRHMCILSIVWFGSQLYPCYCIPYLLGTHEFYGRCCENIHCRNVQ